MHQRRFAVLLALAVLSLFAAGCGGSNDDESSPGGGTTTVETSEAG